MERSWKKVAFSTSPQMVENGRPAGGVDPLVVSPIEGGRFAGSSPAALRGGLLFLLQKSPVRDPVCVGGDGSEPHHVGHGFEVWFQIRVEGGIVVVDRAIGIFQPVAGEHTHHGGVSGDFIPPFE